MTNINEVAEQRVRQYESQLQHIDEVMELANKAGPHSADFNTELTELAEHRTELAGYIKELKEKAPFEWAEEGGPMVLWDVVAERIDELVEHIEH